MQTLIFSSNILQWNCLGLRTRAEILKVLMREHNPGIVCLQETKLGNELFNPGLAYCIYNSTPPPGDRAHGGAAIIVSKNIQHSEIQLNSPLQAVAITATLGKQITICSIYLPGAIGFSNVEIQNLINQLPAPFLVLGDFNAHSQLWGCNTSDPLGSIMENILTTNDIVLLNDGSMTYHNIHSGVSSAIDLSLCSSNLALDFNWSVDEYLNGSDHFPIHLKYVENSPSPSLPKWKEQDADWDKYRNGINIDREFESFKCHLEAYSYLSDKIISSAEASIPKTGGAPRRPAVPWWDKTCAVLRKVTRKCYRRYKNSGSNTTRTIYKRNMAKQRRYFRKRKRDSWIYYINGISSKTPSRNVWRKIKKLSGKYVPPPSPALKINDNLVTDPSEVADTMGKHFSEVSSARNYSEKFKEIRNNQPPLKTSKSNDAAYNAPYSLREFSDALSSTESSSPGEDGIHYSMIRHLPDKAKTFLLKIMNRIWATGILPRSWKIAIIIPIQKPKKDPFQLTSYRPIALTSCACKLMEKMINSRLVWHLESNNLFSPDQFGLRRNRSTLDPMLKLSTQIQGGFATGCQTIGVFFDLEKAYDTTWRHGILKQFQRMGIGGSMFNFLSAFLSDRYFRVRVGSTHSSLYYQEEGVPQGSVLSVTCFAVAINNILESVSPPVRGSLFVDDFVIYVTTYDAVSACRYLQKTINAISAWALENGFKFSSSKTVAMQFKRHKRQERVPNLILNGEILPYEDEVKFLGLIFDKQLTWGSHITNLKNEVKKSLDILKVVSGFDWGADKKSLLRLYDSLCRSKLDYGCQIYSSACKTRLKELDVVHNMFWSLPNVPYREHICGHPPASN
ncbi:MAG: reverse transcriptase family protein [Bacteroidota bacterium]